MINIHDGEKIENALIMKTGRICISLLEADHIESFYIGFADKVNEAHDNIKYNRIHKLSTIRELFYLLGYVISEKEMIYSEQIQKNLPAMRDFKENILTYLNRFDIVTFFERNNQETLQMLP